MKIYEIDKSSFHNKLRYEWMEELETRVNNFNAHTAFENGWRVTLLDDPIRLELSRFEGNKTLHSQLTIQ